MMNGMMRAYRRADCVVLGAAAFLAVSSVSAREFNLYTNELQARAALPDSVAVTASPVSAARARDAAESECLAEVLYYEARGEGIEGEKAVAEVVLQRMRNRDYPETVCGVVHDGVQPGRLDCQFSFACDGSLRKPRERAAWTRMRALADKIMTGAIRLRGVTGRAIAYHNVEVAPAWAGTMLKTAQIGNHVFYRPQPVAQAGLVRMDGMFQRFSFPDRSASSVGPVVVLFPSEQIQPQVQVPGAVGNGA
jgi:spore germination cell wall hydrolase CwlJ-like protein